jgi:hypothetical protein
MYVFVGFDRVFCNWWAVNNIDNIVKWLQAGRSGGSNSREVEIFGTHPDQPWVPPSFLCYGYDSLSWV